MRVTGVSHSGLSGATSAGRGLLHLQVDPNRPRREHLPPEALDAVANEVLRIALVWDADADESLPLNIYRHAPRPLPTPTGPVWWPGAPHRMSQNRIRQEFVTDLRPLLDGDGPIAGRVSAAARPMLVWLAAHVSELSGAVR